MGLIKKSMTWSEPNVVRNMYYPYPLIPFWSHIVFAGVIVVFILIAFLIRTEDPLTEKLAMIGIGVFLGAACGYGIPLLDRLGGANITVGPTGIERMDSSIGYSVPVLMVLKYRRRQWKWKDIAYLYLHTEPIHDRPMQILEIVGHDDKPLGVAGLPEKKFKMEKLLAVLEENNCPLRQAEPPAA